MITMKRLFEALFRFQTRHPYVVLVAGILVAVLSVLYTVQSLGFLTSQRQLISADDRLMRLNDQLDQFDDLDTYVVAIENKDEGRSLEFLNALASFLQADRQHYAQVFFRVDPKLFEPWTLLYLEKKDLLGLSEALQEHKTLIGGLARSPGLVPFFRMINEEMASRLVGELFTGFLDEKPKENGPPMDLDFLIRTLKEMDEALAGKKTYASPWPSLLTKGEQSDGYFRTDNKKYLLLCVTPSKGEEGFAQGGASLAALRDAVGGVRSRFPGINAGVTGPEALDVDEMVVALDDMELATGISLGGLALLLLIFWRGIRRPVIELASLLVALSITFGLTTLFVGHLNIPSVSFAPMLLGLGIDYGVHWISRYREQLEASGFQKEEALRTTMVKLGPGIFLAGVSAALSFFPFVLTGFKGMAELGVICSMGLITATLTTLCFLPSLLFLFDKHGPRTPTLSPGQPRFLLEFTRRRAAVFLIVACLAVGVSIWGAGRVKFDLNMLHLQSRRAESVIWEKKLVGDSKRPSLHGAVLARSLDEVKKKAAALQALPTAAEVQSVADLIPSDQEEKIGIVRRMKPLIAGIGPVRAPSGAVALSELDAILSRIRFKMLDAQDSRTDIDALLREQMLEVRRLIDQVRKRLTTSDARLVSERLGGFEAGLIQDLGEKLQLLRANIPDRSMSLDDLPRPLFQRFVSKDGLFLIKVFPAKDIWDPETLGEFVRSLKSVDVNAIGDPVTLLFFTKAFRDACIKAAIYATVFIFLLLILTFRNIIAALAAIMPLIVGTLWTFGLMHLFGVSLNLANSIFLPLVVGAGVEYGIIIVQRWRQRGEEKRGAGLPLSTGIGVILAGLTTTVGFGSLIVSDHQGLYSLGLLTMIGSLAILAAAVVFLPALLRLVTPSEPSATSSPADPDETGKDRADGI